MVEYPIGTPFIHIVNPFDPEGSAYFGIVISEAIMQPEIGEGLYYEVEYISSSSKYWNPKTPITYMKLNLLSCAVHNYKNYLKDIELERATKNR